MQRALVLGDLHLTRRTPKATTEDLARFVRANGGSRIVFAGDLFDTSAEGKGARAIDALNAHANVREALGEHVTRGGSLWFVAGNHDGEIARESFAGEISDALLLDASSRSRLRTTPWFFREGAVHIEHGHLYDPDNAPAHPLAPGATSLGVHFVESFLAPTGAYAYLNQNDGTPFKMFLSTFKLYGLRAPYVIYRFFHASFGALMESGPFFSRAMERAGIEEKGAERLARFAVEAGLEKETLEDLLEHAATPTLESMRRTFARLYLDRVGASLALLGGTAALAMGQPIMGGAAIAAGAMTMAASWAAGHDRYTGKVHERLEHSAVRVAGASGAKLVIFGHTHKEALTEIDGAAYANTGSFSFPRGAPGRPYLEIDGSWDAPRAVRRYL